MDHNPKPNIAARVDQDIYDELKDRAQKEDRSLSKIVNGLLRGALRQSAHQESWKRMIKTPKKGKR